MQQAYKTADWLVQKYCMSLELDIQKLQRAVLIAGAGKDLHTIRPTSHVPPLAKNFQE